MKTYKSKAQEIAEFYRGAYEPANDGPSAKMCVRINAEDFEKILAQLDKPAREPLSDKELAERREKFEAAARPLMKLLAKEYHPHHTVVVTSNTAEISEGVMSARIDDYLDLND